MVLGLVPAQSFAMTMDDILGLDQQIWLWESAHIEELTPEEEERGVIYMGTVDPTAEEHGHYSLTIYRDGNVDEEATVTLSTADISATIREDYDYYLESATYFDNGGTIMELNANVDVEAQLDALQPEVDALNGATATEEEAEAVDVYQGATTPEALAAVSAETGKSTLALLKEAETGIATREAVSTDGQELTEEQQAAAEALAEYASGDINEMMLTSSTMEVTFAPGETEKYIAIEITDDEISEDNELAMFILSSPKGALLSALNGCTMTITDDDVHEDAFVGFASETCWISGATGELDLIRTGADYYMVAAVVTLLNESGQEMGEQTVTFAPYVNTATVDLDCEGSGTYTAIISNLQACEAGECLSTTVIYDESQLDIMPVTLSAAGDEGFNLSGVSGTNGYPLRVTFSKQKDGSSNTFGNIYDTGTYPQTCVGVYYFTDTMEANYTGKRPNNTHYDHKSSAPNSYMFLQWYSSSIGKNGTVYAKSGDINTTPFAKISVDTAMTKDAYTGNLQKFTFGYDSFTRTQNYSRTLIDVTLGDDWRYVGSSHSGRMEVIDNQSGKTPNTHVYYYGFAAFYSRFNIELNQPGKMSFLNVTDTSKPLDNDVNNITQAAVTSNIGTGHNVRYYGQSLQITSQAVNENNNLLRGTLIGYEIDNQAYSNDKNLWFLASNYDTGDVASSKYDASTDHVIKLAAGTNVSNISFDYNFLINLYSQIRNQNRKPNYELKITPLYAYKNVTVKISSADVIVNDAHTYTCFKGLTAGTKTYHVGDKLRLTAKPPAEDLYFGGYYYVERASADGNGKIIDEGIKLAPEGYADLLLGDGGVNYYELTPVFFENKGNYIYFDSIDADISVCNLLTADQVETLKDAYTEYAFKSELIYMAEPDAAPSTVAPTGKNLTSSEIAAAQALLGQITVIPGKIYSISAFNPKSPTSSIPTFENKYQVGLDENEVVTSWVFDFIASERLFKNQITVGKEASPSVDRFAIEGFIYMPKYSIRESDGVGTMLDLPAKNGNVYAGGYPRNRWVTASGTSTKSTFIEPADGATDENGYFFVPGILGNKGDIVTVHYTNGDIDKVYYITLGVDADCTTSQRNMSYYYTTTNDYKKENIDALVTKAGTVMTFKEPTYLPVYTTGSPSFTSLEYSYNKSENKTLFGSLSNSVAIAKDYLTVTATVNLNGNQIEKAVFTVDKRVGQDTDYVVLATSDYQSTFTCKFGSKEMPDIFGDGDQLYVTLYDANDRVYYTNNLNEDGTQILNADGSPSLTKHSMPVVYSTVYTGLSFYIPTLEVTPQYLTIENPQTYEVPVFGTAKTSTTSGIVSFTKNDWDPTDSYSPYTLIFSGNSNVILNPGINPMDIYNKAQGLRTASKKSADDWGDSLMIAPDDDVKKSMAHNTFKNSMVENFNKNIFNCNVVVFLSFHFAYDTESESFKKIGGQVVMGGTFTVTSNMYSTISGVPVFLQLMGTVESELIINYQCDTSDMELISSDDFYSFDNLSEITKKYDTDQALYIGLSGRATVGVGICGILSARGYLQVDIRSYISFTELTDSSGIMISMSGGIGIDLLFFTIQHSFNLGSVGAGRYAGMSGATPLSLSDPNSMNDIIQNAQTEATIRPYESGNGGKVGAPSPMAPLGIDLLGGATILEDAPERTRPQLLDLGNGTQFLTYVGSKDGVPRLYYTIYKNSMWSEAKLVNAGGFGETTPTLALYGDKVIIAWVGATSSLNLNNAASLKTELSKFNTYACMYDIADGTLSTATSISGDTTNSYMDYSPIIGANPDGTGDIAFLYIKKDLEKLGSNSTDYDAYGKCYEAFVLSIWSGTSAVKLTDKFLPIMDDPLISNLDAVILPNLTDDGDNFLLCSYTADEDKDYNTSDDQEVHLMFYNITDDVTYAPIPVTTNFVPDYLPQLTKLSDGQIFLTWLSNRVDDGGGDMVQPYFYHLEISSILEETDDIYGLDKFFTGTGENWYKVAGGSVAEGYDGSFLESLATGTLVPTGNPVQDDAGNTMTMSDYLIRENNGNLFILWTAPGSTNLADHSMEVYGIMYHDGDTPEAVATNENDDTLNTEADYERSGWSRPVRLTRFGRPDAQGNYPGAVVDELTAIVNNAGSFKMVSNYFTQETSDDNNSGVEYSSNNLISYDISTESYYEITDVSISPAYPKAGDEVTVTYGLHNDGLMPIEGYHTNINFADMTSSDGAKSSEDLVFGGETIYITSTFSLSNTLTIDDNAKIHIEIDGPNDYTASIPYGSPLSFAHDVITFDADENKLILPLLITNDGNKPTEAFTLTLSDGVTDDPDTTAVEVPSTQTVDISAIEPRVTKRVEVKMDKEVLSRKDFSEFGLATLHYSYEGTAQENYLDILSLTDPQDGTQTSTLTLYQPDMSTDITIAGGGQLYMTVGDVTHMGTIKLGSNEIPMGDNVSLAFTDESIAHMDANNCVIAHKVGTTDVDVTVTYEGMDYTKTVTLNVVEPVAEEEEDDDTATTTPSVPSGGGGGGSITPPAEVVPEIEVSTDESHTTGTVTTPADVTSGAIQEAITLVEETTKAGETTEVVLQIEGDDITKVTLPSTDLATLADKVDKVTVETTTGSITLDQATMQTIASRKGSDVTMVIKPTTVPDHHDDAVKNQLTDRPIYSLTILVDGEPVTTFGGKVQVTLPYEPTAGEDTRLLDVFHLADDGTLTQMQNAVYNTTQKAMEFETGHFSQFVIVSNAEKTVRTFLDVPSTSWYAEAIDYVVDHSLFQGMSETSFAPDAPMTRAMAATVFWNYANKPGDVSAHPFTDVLPADWFVTPVAWASEHGITRGMTETTFEPQTPLSRQQLVTFLYRYAGSPGYTGNLDAFTDGGDTASWAKDAMAWAVEQGIIQGKGDLTTLVPNEPTTRAEVATIFMRYHSAQ